MHNYIHQVRGWNLKWVGSRPSHTHGLMLLSYHTIIHEIVIDHLTQCKLASSGKEGQPPCFFFWNRRRTAGRIALKFCKGDGASSARHLAKEYWPGQLSSQGYDVARDKVPERVFSVIVSSASYPAATGWNGNIMRYLGQKLTSIYRNRMSSCSEFNREHAGERFISLRVIFFLETGL